MKKKLKVRSCLWLGKIACALLALVAVQSRLAAASALPNPGDGIYAIGGEVIATFSGAAASHNNDLRLSSPGNVLGIIFNNQSNSVGDTESLGSFSAGTELIFQLDDLTSGNTWYSGSNTRNSDLKVHAKVTDLGGGVTEVGFEDLTGDDADWDYDDLKFTFTSTRPGNVPDSSGTLGLLGLSLFAMVGLRRKLAK